MKNFSVKENNAEPTEIYYKLYSNLPEPLRRLEGSKICKVLIKKDWSNLKKNLFQIRTP